MTALPSKPSTQTAFPKVSIDESFVPDKTKSAVRVKDLSIKDSVLTFVVRYGGGCKEHSFELLSRNNYTKDTPPSLFLFLQHYHQEDLCKKILYDTLSFDVSNIKFPDTKEVVLKLSNCSESILYKY